MNFLFSAQFVGFENEKDLIAAYLDNSRNNPEYFIRDFAVILNTDQATGLPKNFKYRIRTPMELPTQLFQTMEQLFVGPTDYFTKAPFLQIQGCLDQSYIESIVQPTLPLDYKVNGLNVYHR